MQLDRGSVFHFNDPIEFVSMQLACKKERNSKFSLRAWSKQLGFQNPSMLSSVLKGERTLQIELCEKIGRNLKLSLAEQKYFKLLVLQHNSKTDDERMVYSEMLNQARPQSALVKHEIDLDQFRFISDWYHVAILEMVNLKDFVYDTSYIAKRLGKGMSSELVKISIERLIRLGLLEEVKLRKLLKRTNGQLIIDKNIPSSVVKDHHVQFVEFAKESIYKLDFAHRDIRGTTISLNRNDYKSAQEILRRAHSEILALNNDKNGDEVYQLTTQFFQLTEI